MICYTPQQLEELAELHAERSLLKAQCEVMKTALKWIVKDVDAEYQESVRRVMACGGSGESVFYDSRMKILEVVVKHVAYHAKPALESIKSTSDDPATSDVSPPQPS